MLNLNDNILTANAVPNLLKFIENKPLEILLYAFLCENASLTFTFYRIHGNTLGDEGVTALAKGLVEQYEKQQEMQDNGGGDNMRAHLHRLDVGECWAQCTWLLIPFLKLALTAAKRLDLLRLGSRKYVSEADTFNAGFDVSEVTRLL